jgi:hypothetical protein
MVPEEVELEELEEEELELEEVEEFVCIEAKRIAAKLMEMDRFSFCACSRSYTSLRFLQIRRSCSSSEMSSLELQCGKMCVRALCKYIYNGPQTQAAIANKHSTCRVVSVVWRVVKDQSRIFFFKKSKKKKKKKKTQKKKQPQIFFKF